jgi:hypothetical protein
MATRILSGRMLVYDWIVGQWSVWLGDAEGAKGATTSVDAVIWRDKLTLLAPQLGYVFAESTGFLDDGEAIVLKVVTGWLSFATLQGFQRLYRVLVLGTYASDTTLRLGIAYDYDATIAESVQGSVIAAPMQWQFQPARQKCEAVQLTLYDTDSSSGEGLSLTGLTFIAGIKRGQFRLPASKSLI